MRPHAWLFTMVPLGSLLSGAAYAMPDNFQDPPAPFIYLLGREIARDMIGYTETPIPDGVPDTWLRMSARNLGFYIGRGSGGYYVKNFILRTKGTPYRQWDTIPNNGYPLLQVYRDGKLINRADGSISGYNPPGHGVHDLFIGDDGLIATRHLPMSFEIHTLDGVFKTDVRLYDIWDLKPD